MKKIFRFTLTGILSFGSLLMAENSRAQEASVSFQVFYDQLSPYGSWVNYNQYGYVWIPTGVSQGFRPYGSSGHWVFTSDGWTWASDYSWGWAPFHYGNWFYDDGYGWMWIPGYNWAPAWVTWGEYGDNYGWAPIGPNIEIAAAWNSYRPPAYYWTFVPRNYMGRSNMNNYYVHYNTNVTVVRNITVINNIHSGGGRPQYMRGPQANNVEKYTHTTIRPVAIRESARPGRERVQNGQLAVYRPSVSRAPSPKPAAPSRVQDLHSVRPTKLPGYNRNVQRTAPQTNGNNPAPARPGANPTPARPGANPAPARPGANHAPVKPAPVNQNRASNPTPARQPVRPSPNNHPAPTHTPRPATQQQPPNHAAQTQTPRPVQHQQTARPAPQQQTARPPAQHQQIPRHAPQPQSPRPVPQQQTPRPAPPQQTPRPVQHQQTPRPAPAPHPAPPANPDNKPDRR